MTLARESDDPGSLNHSRMASSAHSLSAVEMLFALGGFQSHDRSANLTDAGWGDGSSRDSASWAHPCLASPGIAPPFVPIPSRSPGTLALIVNCGWKASSKRLTDIMVALLLILCAAPVMVMISIAIKCTSPGPVIFRQERLGLHGKVFVVFKFRTMYSHFSDPLSARQTSKRDGRVTPVGRFLRSSSLDELPQFFNVLLGSMSLVGPRPHALGTSVNGIPLEIADARYPLRHLVRPGITGWAQVNGSRGALLSVEQLMQRIDHDLYYVQRCNPVLDLRIMLRTLVLLITERNAC